jgi:tetratricopeptide (TPR) repeat protein
MREAVRLATEGRTDSARSIVQRQLRNVPRTDTSYAEILFTAGVVSDDVETAMMYFRQLSIEYANSSWADQGWLRIAQLSYASGDRETAIRSADRILIDYPLSDVRAEASFIAARAHLDLRDTDAGCRYLDQARREAGENVEIRNRAAFYLQRCASILGPDSLAEETPPPPAPTEKGFMVQVTAVGNASAADELMRALMRDGHRAQVVREEGLFKVRVGPFTTRHDAQEMAAQLRQQVGGRPFVLEIP